LGGRLDSTNVSKPILSIITNVGWDHMDLLGDTLEAIAFEKAGILKSGVPTVLGKTPSSTLSVFNKAAEKVSTRLCYAPDCWQIDLRNATEVTGWCSDGRQLQSLQFGLGGWYQSENLSTVLTAVDELRSLGYQIEEEHLRAGLAHVKERTGLRGRWEVLGQHPFVVADTAHNQPGFEATMNQFREVPAKHKRMVLGFVRDKAVEKLIGLLPSGVTLFLAPPSVPRALDLDGLRSISNLPPGTRFYVSVEDAVHAAIHESGSEDALYIGGSTFVVSDALPLFLKA
jgi:dihydrofolate synthase/folylpolyglutamate synthase